MKLIKFISSRQSWSIPYAIFAAIFVVLPLLLIVFFAFTDEYGHITLYNFQKFLAHPEAINTFVYSIGIAFLNTLLCILLGYPAAYILTQTKMKYANTIVMLFILPMWVNILVRTLATVALFDFRLSFPVFPATGLHVHHHTIHLSRQQEKMELFVKRTKFFCNARNFCAS